MDFVTHSNITRIDHRQAVQGIADHDCILHDTPVADYDSASRWPKVKKIDRVRPEHEVLEGMATKWVRQVATVLRGDVQERRGDILGNSDQRRRSHAHTR